MGFVGYVAPAATTPAAHLSRVARPGTPAATHLQVGERVRLHIMSFGSVDDTHSVHMGGPRLDYNRQHSDAVQISPGGMISADVAFTAPGARFRGLLRGYRKQCSAAVSRGVHQCDNTCMPAPVPSRSHRFATCYQPHQTYACLSLPASRVFPHAGNYELQCRMAHHIIAGMRARYAVFPADPQAAPQLPATQLTGVTRTYFVQAEPVEWDYAPAGYQK